MNVKGIISGGYRKDRVFADSVLDRLEQFFVFVCPVEGGQILNQVVKGLTIQMEFFNIATVEAKASKKFHDVLFTFR